MRKDESKQSEVGREDIPSAPTGSFRARVLEWLRADGVPVEEVAPRDESIEWQAAFGWPRPVMATMNLVSPVGEPDCIQVLALVTISKQHRDAVADMSLDERRAFHWRINEAFSVAPVMVAVEHEKEEGLELVPKAVMIETRVYEDGGTKHAFFQALASVHAARQRAPVPFNVYLPTGGDGKSQG